MLLSSSRYNTHINQAVSIQLIVQFLMEQFPLVDTKNSWIMTADKNVDKSWCKLHVSMRTTDISPCSSLLRDVLRGGTSVTQPQKFHTDDVNQCLHNKSGSHWVPNANLFNFMFLLVDFGEVFCSSANELEQKSNATLRKDYISQILTVLVEIHRIYIWPLQPFVFCLSFENNS